MRTDVKYYIRRMRIASAIRRELKDFQDTSGRFPLRPEDFVGLDGLGPVQADKHRLQRLIVRNLLGFPG